MPEFGSIEIGQIRYLPEDSVRLIGSYAFEYHADNSPEIDISFDLGPDQYLSIGDTTLLQSDIFFANSEYFWYNSEGNLISQDSVFVASSITEEYWLKIRLKETPYFSEDAVLVIGSLGIILSTYPNPVISGESLSVEYELSSECTQASLLILDYNGTSISYYSLDILQSNIEINSYSLTQGSYGVLLLVDGNPTDFKQILIQ